MWRCRLSQRKTLHAPNYSKLTLKNLLIVLHSPVNQETPTLQNGVWEGLRVGRSTSAWLWPLLPVSAYVCLRPPWEKPGVQHGGEAGPLLIMLSLYFSLTLWNCWMGGGSWPRRHGVWRERSASLGEPSRLRATRPASSSIWIRESGTWLSIMTGRSLKWCPFSLLPSVRNRRRSGVCGVLSVWVRGRQGLRGWSWQQDVYCPGLRSPAGSSMRPS